jgi:predicted transcriptional regulator
MTGEDGPNTKVGRVIETYDLDDLGARLEVAWTGETGERTSLRDLADEFNEAVLAAAVRETAGSSLDVEASSTYEALRNGTGSEATRARRRLEREGVDVDELTADFVTHQAVHTYLTEDRGASLPTDETDRAERKIETIEKLQGRLSAVTESAISSLASADELDRDDYDVLVDVRGVCPHCGADASVVDLIRRGGCGCTSEDESPSDD